MPRENPAKVIRRRKEWGGTSPISCFFSIVVLSIIGYGAYMFLNSQKGAVKSKGASIAADMKQSNTYDSVHIGMSANDLKAAIGSPERVEDRNDQFNLPEKWIYSQGHITVEFQNGFVAAKHQQ